MKGSHVQALDLVVDTSAILSVVLNEPTKPTLIRLTENRKLIAPASLHWEIGNALSAMQKRKRLTLEETLKAITEYRKIPISFVDIPLPLALQISEKQRIYAYDAYFIACAEIQATSLLTLDGGLRTAALAHGINIIEVAMKQYSYSEARQHLTAIMDQAQRDGGVRIQRRDGQIFILIPESHPVSPLDIEGITPASPINREDILLSISESREDRGLWGY